MSTTVRWSDLDDKGFVVARGFLGAAEIDTLLQGFDQGTAPDEYPFGFKLIGRAALRSAWSRIETVLPQIREQTSVRVDSINFLTLSHYIATRLAERSSFFHQDFDMDYKLTRDHVNYLNFWIPLRKPDAARSNVTLIPFDSLRARAPDVHGFLVGNGGYRFVADQGRTLVFGRYGSILSADDAAEPERRLDFDIEELGVTPFLDAGDLLLMRGDVIHRTQDRATERVAASIRVTYSAKVITRERAFPNDGAGVTNKAASNISALLRDCFAKTGRSEVTVGELVKFAQGQGAR